MERDRRIGREIELKFDELDGIKRTGWENKLKAAGYVSHRTEYRYTEVPTISVHDSSPKSYVQKYVAGLIGYLLPEDAEWGRLVYGRAKNTGVRRYTSRFEKEREEQLEWITSEVFQNMTDSNFYTTAHMVGLDREIMGIGVMHVEDGWDSGEKGIIFKCIDPQECVVAYSPRGLCDVFIRKTWRSAIDLVREYGDSHEMKATKQKLKGSGSEGLDCCVYEAVLPRNYLWNFEENEFERFKGNKPYVHIVYLHDDFEILAESGFDVMPISTDVRMLDSEKRPYGEGLVEMCLPEIRKLDDLANLRQLVRQKNAEPPMYIPNSLRGRFSGKARAENYGPSGGTEVRPSPIYTTIDQSGYSEDIEDLKRNLRNLIPVDLFETLLGSTDSRKTATEVQMRKNEAMILLALSIGDMKRNLLEPVFKRCAKIVVKHTDFGDGSNEMREKLNSLIDESRLELNSVFIRRLNAYLQNEGDDAIVNAMINMYGAYPQVMDVVDMDPFLQKYFLGKGLSASFIRGESEIEKLRNARAQIQQQQLEAQNGALEAKANADNAKAYESMGINGGGGQQ